MPGQVLYIIENQPNIGKMKVTEDILFKYFRGKASKDEKNAISRWLGESDDNKVMFREASDLYEEFIMTAPLEALNPGNALPEGRAARRNHRKILYAFTNIAAVVAIAACLWLIIDHRYENRMADSLVTVEIPAGHRMDITLADGTKVKLNSGACFKYPQSFSSSLREVYLDGEAFFDVTHNEKKPFVVNTYNADIKVLGTSFEVVANESEHEFSTTLVEGKVVVECKNAPNEEIALEPSQKVTMENGHLSIEDADLLETALWTDGILDITGTDFGKLMRKMEKAYGVRILIQRAEMPEIECVGGKVRISDGVEHALELLRQLSEFQFTNDRQTGTIYIK